MWKPQIPVNSNNFRHVFKLCRMTYKGQNSQLLSITYRSTMNTFNMLYDNVSLFFSTTTVVAWLLYAIDNGLIIFFINLCPWKINHFFLCSLFAECINSQLWRSNCCQTEPCLLEWGKWSIQLHIVIFLCVKWKMFVCAWRKRDFFSICQLYFW